jgi:carbon-monoxide dehydrogenase medium subunit
MKPAPFKYALPRSLQEALELKAKHGDEARFLAGGQSLIPMMNFRLAQPAILIDLNGLSELDYVRQVDAGALRVGALTRHRDMLLNPLVRNSQPLVTEAMTQVAHPQIRNRGTLCGNLAHADPASEMSAVMLASGARFHACSAMTDRWIEVTAFFRGVFETALTNSEMLVEVEMPAMPARTGTAFVEFARRPGDYAVTGVAAAVTLDEQGACARCRLAYCNAHQTPIRAVAAENALVGARISEAEARAAGEMARREIEPPDDVHASGAYKRHLIGALTRRAVVLAQARAAGQAPATAARSRLGRGWGGVGPC